MNCDAVYTPLLASTMFSWSYFSYVGLCDTICNDASRNPWIKLPGVPTKVEDRVFASCAGARSILTIGLGQETVYMFPARYAAHPCLEPWLDLSADHLQSFSNRDFADLPLS